MNLRAASVGGAVKNPSFLEGNGAAPVPALTDLAESRFVARAVNRDILFGVHGFNVNRAAGLCALGRLEASLDLPASCLFVGVLWPGDFWLPVVNYPFEGGTAMDCGRRLSDFCNRRLGEAGSFSFVSHSLGARLTLAAVRGLDRKARSVCLTAGAINDDCLTGAYADAFANANVVSVLASRSDHVLRLAYPVGDAIADLLHFDHKPFAAALGYSGPKAAVGATVPPWQIDKNSGYDHGNYLPPSDPAAAFPDPNGKWMQPAGFMSRAFRGQPQSWP